MEGAGGGGGGPPRRGRGPRAVLGALDANWVASPQFDRRLGRGPGGKRGGGASAGAGAGGTLGAPPQVAAEGAAPGTPRTPAGGRCGEVAARGRGVTPTPRRASRAVGTPATPSAMATPGRPECERMLAAFQRVLGASEPGAPLTPGSGEERRFQEWLCDLGLPRELICSPVVAKLKQKWAVELENASLREVLRKVKDQELEMAAAEAAEAADLYQAFETECQDLAHRNEGLSQEAAGLRADLHEAQVTIQHLRQKGVGGGKSPWEMEMLEEAHAAIESMTLENTKLAAEKEKIEELRGNLSCEKKELQLRVQKLTTQFEDVVQQNRQYRAEMKGREDQYREIKEGLGGVQEMVLARERLAASEVSGLREQHVEAAAKAEALTAELRASEERLESFSGEKRDLEARLNTAIAELESCRAVSERSELKMEEDMEEASSRIAALTLQNKHLSESLKKAQAERETIGEDIATTSKVLAAIQSNSWKAAEAAQQGRLKDESEGLAKECATALMYLQQVQQENSEMKHSLAEMSAALAQSNQMAEERVSAASRRQREAEQLAARQGECVGQLQAELTRQASECERLVQAAKVSAFELKTEVDVSNAALEAAAGENLKLKEAVKGLQRKGEEAEEARKGVHLAPAVVLTVPVLIQNDREGTETPFDEPAPVGGAASLEATPTAHQPAPRQEVPRAASPESPRVDQTADVFREALLEVRLRSRRAARRRAGKSRRPAADPEYQRRLRALGLPVSPLIARRDRAGN